MLNAEDLKILAQLRDSDSGELVREGKVAYIDDDEVPASIVTKFLQVLAISDVSDVKGIERYVISSTGKAILFNPDIQHSLITAIRSSNAFTIANGKVTGL